MGKIKILIIQIVVLNLIFAIAVFAEDCDKPELSTGQRLYVPAYSNITYSDSDRPFLLYINLSIRNIDEHNKIMITKVDYYETKGKLMVEHIDTVIVLGPLESMMYMVPEKDESGGSGANFIVEWSAEKCTNPPIVESIMIGRWPTEGVSFTSRGQVIVDSER